MSPFQTKTLKVLILEPLASRRAQYSEALREIGIKDITGAATVEDGLALVAAEEKPYHWILTPLTSEKHTSGFHFLHLALSSEKHRNLKVSFLLKPEEHYVLNHAFELGLLSFHERDQVAKDFAQDIELFFHMGKLFRWELPLLAGHYLRGHHKASNALNDAMSLTRALMTRYPNEPHLLMNLGELQILTGKTKEGIDTFGRARSLDPSLAHRIESIIDQALKGRDNMTPSSKVALAVIVDPDASARKTLNETLLTMGVEKIVAFQDGEEAWAWINANNEPDLVIQEWRLPKLSGNLLVQRVRAKGFKQVPIIIYSSLVKMGDVLLLKEMGVTDVIEKPLSKKLLLATFQAGLNKERAPKDVDALVTKIRKLLDLKKTEEAASFFERLAKMEKVGQDVLGTLKAEILYGEGKTVQSKKLALATLQEFGPSVFLYQVLAKAHIKLGEHADAASCLEKANAFNPQNVARLCALAELNGIQGEGKAAQAALESAKTLDDGNMLVVEAEAKVALSQGDTAASKNLLQTLPSQSSLVAYLNNSAVVLASKGEVTEAIKLYERGLIALDQINDRVSETVRYNLSLAQAKAGNLREAETNLKIVAEKGFDNVRAKAMSLLKRVQTALRSGGELELLLNKAGGELLDEKDSGEINAAVPDFDTVKPGDACLYKIYSRDGDPDPRVIKLFPKKTLVRPGNQVS